VPIVTSRLGTLLSALALAAVLAAGAGARQADTTAPSFAGLKSATTCIPGPIGSGRMTRYTLKWDAATDDATTQEKLVYLVYQATAPGGEDFTAPTYTARHGVTTFHTPKLSTTETFYFVVRARDRAGNVDQNKVERQGVNLCV
jgi:hypothetical protein